MEAEVKLYQVTKGAARWKNIPLYFVAKQLAESGKAVYLYGHGTTETVKMGVCMVCGRTLTHPVSVELGIGPECGAHYWNWNLVGGYTKENIARLMEKIKTDIIIDTWIPKSLIVEVSPSIDIVHIPTEHPILKGSFKNGDADGPKRLVSIAKDKYNERVLKINFPYNQDDLNNVRTLPGRRFHADDKCWSVPVSIEAIEALQKWGFVLDAKVEEFHTKTTAPKVNVNLDFVIPGLKRELFAFQKKGVAFVESNNGRALIADEMGLGKTIQALAYLQLHPEFRPVIIVVPASLKFNWRNEAQDTMTNISIQILSGSQPYKITGNVIIINYDILTHWVDTLKAIEPQVLITDECHYYKSNSANRTKAVKQLAKGIPHVIALSGTPIVNRPVEAFNAINIIDNSLFPNAWSYLRRYCNARHNGYGWDFSGASNTQELHDKLTGSIMIRRKKSDVLLDLPDKIRSFVPIELDNQSDYNQAEDDFIAFLRKNKGLAAAERASNAEALATIEGLKQLAVRGKLNDCISWIENFLESDQKLVVFATHKFVIEELMNAFPDITVKIDGSVSGEDRQKAVEAFQNDPKIRLFVGNIKAAGVGITLTSSSNVAFMELPWTPGDLIQAEDRCHRIGQKDTVNIYYLLASGTIEEKIAKLIDKKRKILDSVLDGQDTDQASLLSELMKQFE